MYVYRKTEPSLWTVGHYIPDTPPVWEPESDFPSKLRAANRVHFLNGGGSPEEEASDTGTDTVT